MYKVTREFHFSASHIIHELDSAHPEASLHGHNYSIKVEVKGKLLNQKIFILDIQKFDMIESWLKLELHRRHLNDVFGKLPTSNENLCHWLYYAFKGMINEISAVELSDEPGNTCRYEE